MDAFTGSAGTPPAESGDPVKAQNHIARLRDNQNLGGALAGGLLGAVAGAALWAVITALTKFHIGWEVIGVGLLTGFGVRTLGRGVDPIFGYIGAVFTLFGIVLGRILSAMVFVAADQHIPYWELASRMTINEAWVILTARLAVVQLLFFGAVIYYGYRASFHRAGEQQLRIRA